MSPPPRHADLHPHYSKERKRERERGGKMKLPRSLLGRKVKNGLLFPLTELESERNPRHLHTKNPGHNHLGLSNVPDLTTLDEDSGFVCPTFMFPVFRNFCFLMSFSGSRESRNPGQVRIARVVF
ncbi:hypothetical protein CEXT_316351 [Caerostris extrusa]|uniref:Uncharacterized protein n=1 Tax=Caerostris extrusa TaxID=172846 RepID=A0AAV4VKT3_CAEEX|nr:hypothetical protein CEXT_316351 [Caerostris extrusa]